MGGIKFHDEESGYSGTKLLLERILRHMSSLGVDTTEWKFYPTCLHVQCMSIYPKRKHIRFCPHALKGLPDDALLHLIAHEISHIRTRDEALATIYAVKMLKNRIHMPENSIMEELEVWYELYIRGYLDPDGLFKEEYVERIKKYLDGKITLEELCDVEEAPRVFD